MIKKLGKKQQSRNEDFVEVWKNIQHIISKSHIDELLEKTSKQVTETIRPYRRVCFGWSGGKDSQALLAVMRLCGIEGCLMGMSDLEYPEFLRWVTDNMPDDLTLYNNRKLNFQWLLSNQYMLFPENASIASKWFGQIQRRAQRLHCNSHNSDLLILGRRVSDGNWMGKDGSGLYLNCDKRLVYCPLRDWSHEEVLAVCFYYNYPLPPIYNWVNGYIVGTGAWPARQYTGTKYNGWVEVFSIDTGIVSMCADYFPEARLVLDNLS